MKLPSANQTEPMLHLQYTCGGTENTLAECRSSWLQSPVAHECKNLSGVMCGGECHYES